MSIVISMVIDASCCTGTMEERGLYQEQCSRSLTEGRPQSMLRRYAQLYGYDFKTNKINALFHRQHQIQRNFANRRSTKIMPTLKPNW